VDLEFSEKRGAETPAQLLQLARHWIAHNLAQMECAGLPAPADAIDSPLDWEPAGYGYRRGYTIWDCSGRRLKLDELLFVVQIQGHQYSDGTIRRTIYALAELEGIDAAEARQIGAAFIAAADALDAIDG
jgi:hypothetical protein